MGEKFFKRTFQCLSIEKKIWEIDRQSRFDVWDRVLRAGALR